MSEIVTRLQTLKLPGMATAWQELNAESRRQSLSKEAMLIRLLDAALADRKARSLQYQMRTARFPHHRDFANFIWDESPLKEVHLAELAAGRYLKEASNVILVGGTGTGKTHLATALGVSAIPQGKRARFYNAVELVNELDREKQIGKAG